MLIVVSPAHCVGGLLLIGRRKVNQQVPVFVPVEIRRGSNRMNTAQAQHGAHRMRYLRHDQGPVAPTSHKTALAVCTDILLRPKHHASQAAVRSQKRALTHFRTSPIQAENETQKTHS